MLEGVKSMLTGGKRGVRLGRPRERVGVVVDDVIDHEGKVP